MQACGSLPGDRNPNNRKVKEGSIEGRGRKTFLKKNGYFLEEDHSERGLKQPGPGRKGWATKLKARGKSYSRREGGRTKSLGPSSRAAVFSANNG